jgi:hypothetical protein
MKGEKKKKRREKKSFQQTSDLKHSMTQCFFVLVTCDESGLGCICVCADATDVAVGCADDFSGREGER